MLRKYKPRDLEASFIRETMDTTRPVDNRVGSSLIGIKYCVRKDVWDIGYYGFEHHLEVMNRASILTHTQTSRSSSLLKTRSRIHKGLRSG